MPEVLVAVLEVRGEVLLEVLEGLFELVAGVEVLEVVSAQQLVNAPLVPAVGRISVRLAGLEPDALGGMPSTSTRKASLTSSRCLLYRSKSPCTLVAVRRSMST
jgi:hypothetical protein